MSDYSEDQSPALSETLAALSESLTHLQAHLARVEGRLDSLKKSPPNAKAKSPSTAPAPKKASRRASRKLNIAAATITPVTGVPAPKSIPTPKSTKAALERTTLTLAILDDQAGHVVGRAGSGLRQIHELSNAKVSLSLQVTAGQRSITIRGTDREIGDALSAIGKRIAHR